MDNLIKVRFGNKGLLQNIFNDFGLKCVVIDNLQNIVTEYMKLTGWCRNYDLIADDATNVNIGQTIHLKTEVKAPDQIKLGDKENTTGRSNGNLNLRSMIS